VEFQAGFLDDASVIISGVAVAAVGLEEETVQRREAKDDKKPKKQPPYHVILWNDDDHTYQYVVAMLQKLFGHPVEKGYSMAVDENH
jgi:ATP-dependent Clp protease adaptor protein ClpS